MAAVTLNISIDQGADWKDTLILYQPAPANTPLQDLVVLDLTGYVARMQIRASHVNEAVLAELTSSNGGLTITPILGKIVRHLTALQTKSITPTNTPAVYDLEIVSSNGEVTRLVQGSVTINPEVTR